MSDSTERAREMLADWGKRGGAIEALAALLAREVELTSALAEAQSAAYLSALRSAVDEVLRLRALAPAPSQPVAPPNKVEPDGSVWGSFVCPACGADGTTLHRPGTQLGEAPAPDTVPVPRVVAWSGGQAPYRFLRVILDDTPQEHEYVPAQPAPPKLVEVVSQILDAGHLNTEDLARLRAAWERAQP